METLILESADVYIATKKDEKRLSKNTMLFFHSRQELAVCLVDALVLCSAADAVEEHEATDAADDLLFDANEKMHYFAKKNIRKLPTHVNVGLDTCLHRVEKECKKRN